MENISVPSPELASFLRQFYGTDSKYFYRTGRNEHTIITAREGIEQGDPAGPALFACGLKAPLDELRSRLESMAAAVRNHDAGFEGDSKNDVRSCSPSAFSRNIAASTATFAYLDDTVIAVPPS